MLRRYGRPLSEVENAFVLAVEQSSPITGNANMWRPSYNFGASNALLPLGDSIFLGPNLGKVGTVLDAYNGIVFFSSIRFAEEEVFLAFYVQSDIASLRERLKDMLARGNAGEQGFSPENDNAKLFLARDDGNFYLGNSAKGETLSVDLARSTGSPPVAVDRVAFAVYPPTLYKNLMTLGFIEYLEKIVGPKKLTELTPWPGEEPSSPTMRREPTRIPLAEIQAAIADLGGHYPPDLVERFHIALNFHYSKHLVILTGISGSGKTGLARRYAKAIHGITSDKEADRYLFECPVRPDWTDPTGLTGYFDVISGQYVVPQFLKAVITAINHRDSPVFVLLDEMNLARVEYYFSDVLSAIESGNTLQLHSHHTPLQGSTGGMIPGTLPLPANLYIIGTVNVDETTHPFSDKVLDRAVVIDMSTIDLDGFFQKLQLEDTSLRPAIDVGGKLLKDTLALLAPHGLAFGYRTAEECLRYYAAARNLGSTRPDADLLDEQLTQKILPKLRGTERQRSMLAALDTLFASRSLMESQKIIQGLLAQLAELSSFQNTR